MRLSGRLPLSLGLILINSSLIFPSCLRSGGNRNNSEPVLAIQTGRSGFRFASGNSARNIPFQEDDGHIFLQVRINNSEPLWFALDTGAIRSIVDKRAAQTLGLKSERSESVGGAGGREQASIFDGISIKLPGVELYNQTVWGLPLDFLSPVNGRRIDGIIGYELFNYFVVDIDYISLKINLYEPQKYDYRGPGRNIPLKVQPDGEIYVIAKLQIAGGEPIEGEFVIDTGGSGTLMLTPTFVQQHRLLELIGPTLQAAGGGVGGSIQVEFARIRTLELGGFVTHNPVTGFVRVGQIAAVDKAGNIGGKYLRRFRVIFDYSRQRMTLEPNANFPAPDEFDMSGAALIADGPDLSVIKVLRVRPNSPASAAGLRPQDVIEAVDGKAIRELTKLKQLFRQPDKEYLLNVRRAEETIQLKIKLKRLV
jgi:hypothetical protein